ncbi:hypothetical protein QCA50_012478 [Cerrena zonata]|uniref:Carboxylic ester hydrolase n=1 Tax=Cerrena zonata TaxID=2478898 RepID=A0AAW0FUM0_9APHY
MLSLSPLLSVGVLLLQASQLVFSTQTRCSTFTLRNPSVNAVVANTTFFKANDTVAITNPFSSIDVSDLPAFCRVVLAITTNATAKSTAHAEIWLPEPQAWNGRFLGLGNGGFGGGVNVADLGFVAIVQGFAGMSTDTGHLSSPLDGSWAGPHNDNAINDWSWRALHLSTVAGKEVVQQYYGKPHHKAYYLGCSTGGRQGLKEAQRFPEDFDGIIVGSPANWMAHLSPWGIHVNLQVMPFDSPRFIPADTWTNVIHAEVLKQCDAIDGLEDGILNDPRKCSFRPETLTCRPGQNTSTCLNVEQITAVHKIFSTYFETNQKFIFNGYYPGGEVGYPFGLVGTFAFQILPDYYRFFVLNDTSFTIDQLNDTVIQLGETINPGTMDVVDPDLTAFLGPAHNGKILQYVGWADQLISSGNSIHFYETVHAFTQANTQLDIDDSYRLFTAPGMQHCLVGWLWSKRLRQASMGMPPASLDAEHNIVAAMVRWVEEGHAPETLTATYWNHNNFTEGVGFTRPLCKYPQMSMFKGGNPNDAGAFLCV